MIDATLLFKGASVYSPWFARQADMLTVTGECAAVNGATITIKLYTKKTEETGNGAEVDTGTTITLSATGRSTAEWRTKAAQEGVEELLRFRYDVTGTNDTDWILFRMLSPSWFNALQEP